MKTENFLVKWTHETYTPDVPEHLKTMTIQKMYSRIEVPIKRNKTIVTIDVLESSTIPNFTTITASVGQYYKDIPNRRVGNKQAFIKAVKQIPNKAIRTELWDAYKSLSPKCIDC